MLQSLLPIPQECLVPLHNLVVVDFFPPFRFSDPTLQGSARLGHATSGGGVMPPDVDAYTKSTQVHRLGPPVDAAKEIQTIDPYAARYVRT